MSTILLKAELPILVLAGIVGQKVAAKLWVRATGRDVPDTAQREVKVALLIPAAILEGTLYKLFRMGIDRALRHSAHRSEGVWIGRPGDGE
jgi:Protein of unknown function (DUF4235)